MGRKKKEIGIKCKVCKKDLDKLELDFYKRTKDNICLDCENQLLDQQGIELDKFGKELDEYV